MSESPPPLPARAIRGLWRWSRSRSAVVFAWFVLIVGGTLGTPAVLWHLQGSTDIDVLVVDKTVPILNYREHEGLTWLLRHRKIRHRTSAQVDVLDYAGYHPERESPVVPIVAKRNSLDFAYVADTYGVYEADLGIETPDGERTELVYGGLRPDEVRQLVGAMRPGATLMAEFNSLASPTQGAARVAFGQAVGVRWTGWIGRHYDELALSPDLPSWLPQLYKRQTGYRWRYRGPGYIFVSEDEQLVVLDEGIDTKSPGIEMLFSKQAQERYGTPERETYDYWFDIVEPVGTTTVLATYEMSLKRRGLRLLKEAGIPTSFPAIVRRDGPGHIGYYLAGDLADLAGLTTSYRYRGIPSIQRALVDRVRDDQAGFFWRAYEPFMTRVLQDVAAAAK